LSTKIESPSCPVPPEVQELVSLETLKELLTVATCLLNAGEAADLAEVSRHINATADEVMSTSLNLGRLPLTPEAQQQRQELLAELRQQRSFCRAMLRRWRRSILLRQQLLDLAAEPVTYTECLDPRWYSHD